MIDFGVMLEIMIEIDGCENIGFSPDLVYKAGIRAETWPEITGLALRPSDEELAIGGLIKVGLRIPGVGVSIGLNARVKDMVPGQSVFIESERNRLAAARIMFDLQESAGDSTDVMYNLKLRADNLVLRAAESKIRSFVEKMVPVFIEGYSDNITRYLEAEAKRPQEIHLPDR